MYNSSLITYVLSSCSCQTNSFYIISFKLVSTLLFSGQVFLNFIRKYITVHEIFNFLCIYICCYFNIIVIKYSKLASINLHNGESCRGFLVLLKSSLPEGVFHDAYLLVYYLLGTI